MQANDEKLWQIARARAAFKRHLAVYLLVNAFLWLTWYLNGSHLNNGIPWPAFSTLGWGLGLMFHALRAYGGRQTLEEKEFQKLKNKQR